MLTADAEEAALILLDAWRSGGRINELPESCRPASRSDGYQVQAALMRQSGQPHIGWKIAATSAAGQSHIGVDGPLAGPLLEGRCFGEGKPVSMRDNLMGVVEAEFAFRLGRDLPARETPYTLDEVMQAVDAAYPAIEIPDSRFADFASVGTAQLVADCACASWFVLGEACPPAWRSTDLTRHAVAVHCNGELACEGSGANVLADPRIAMTWIANELCAHAQPLMEGEIVTTGTCITPLAAAKGDHVRADFGALGSVEVLLS